MMDIEPDHYRQMALERLDRFLAGGSSVEALWKWAEQIVVSDVFEKLPFYLQDAIHGIWLLHDGKEPWVPDRVELVGIRDDLAFRGE